jgi:hypothetical protein
LDHAVICPSDSGVRLRTCTVGEMTQSLLALQGFAWRNGCVCSWHHGRRRTKTGVSVQGTMRAAHTHGSPMCSLVSPRGRRPTPKLNIAIKFGGFVPEPGFKRDRPNGQVEHDVLRLGRPIDTQYQDVGQALFLINSAPSLCLRHQNLRGLQGLASHAAISRLSGARRPNAKHGSGERQHSSRDSHGI